MKVRLSSEFSRVLFFLWFLSLFRHSAGVWSSEHVVQMKVPALHKELLWFMLFCYVCGQIFSLSLDN